MKKILLFALLIFFCRPTHACTEITVGPPNVWQAALTQADIQTCMGLASTGDKIVATTGSANWSGTITMTWQGDLECAVVGACNITNTNVTSCGPNNGSPCPAGSQLINVTLGTATHTIIGGFNFIVSPGICTGNPCQGADITIQGTCSTQVPLLHDLTFGVYQFQMVQALQWLVGGGVLWNTTFNGTVNTQGLTGGSFAVKAPTCSGAGQPPPWDAPDTFGTADTTGLNNLYVEDSTCNNVDQIPDMDDNARVVIRHSTWNGCAGLTHGTTSTVGGRSAELVNDIITAPGPNSLIPSNPCTVPARNIARYFWWRAGNGVITNNQISLLSVSGSCGFSGTSFQAAAEQAQRATDPPNGAHGCAQGRLGWHQPGSGSDGVTHTPSNVVLGVVSTTGAPLSTSDDPKEIADPIYLWNNTGGGATIFTYNDGTPNGCGGTNGAQTPPVFPPNSPVVGGVTTSTGLTACGPPQSASCIEWATSNLVQTGRDVIIGTARPGYVICTTGPCGYPHPLRALVSGGNVVFSPPNISYGSVPQGTQSATQFSTLTNSSGSTITLTSLSACCGIPAGASSDFASTGVGNTCNFGGGTLANGASCVFGAYFRPTQPGGTNESSTYQVAYTGATGSPALLSLSGTSVGNAAATITPATVLAFPNTVPNTTSAAQTITVTSTGSGNLVLAGANAVTLTGANASNFAITGGITCTNGLTLTPTQSCVIPVTFTPTSAGLFSAQITLTSNGTGSPQVELLAGSGASVAPTPILTILTTEKEDTSEVDNRVFSSR